MYFVKYSSEFPFEGSSVANLVEDHPAAQGALDYSSYFMPTKCDKNLTRPSMMCMPTKRKREEDGGGGGDEVEDPGALVVAAVAAFKTGDESQPGKRFNFGCGEMLGLSSYDTSRREGAQEEELLGSGGLNYANKHAGQIEDMEVRSSSSAIKEASEISNIEQRKMQQAPVIRANLRLFGQYMEDPPSRKEAQSGHSPEWHEDATTEDGTEESSDEAVDAVDALVRNPDAGDGEDADGGGEGNGDEGFAGNENRRYECQFCRRAFSSSQALGGHQNAHKRERLAQKKEQEKASRARNSKPALRHYYPPVPPLHSRIPVPPVITHFASAHPAIAMGQRVPFPNPYFPPQDAASMNNLVQVHQPAQAPRWFYFCSTTPPSQFTHFVPPPATPVYGSVQHSGYPNSPMGSPIPPPSTTQPQGVPLFTPPMQPAQLPAPLRPSQSGSPSVDARENNLAYNGRGKRERRGQDPTHEDYGSVGLDLGLGL